MDPLSQAALGAVVAQSVGYRHLGFKAGVVGALAGAMPDIDVLFSINGDFIDQLISHRGITHSLFFGPVVGPVLGWLIYHHELRRNPHTDPKRLKWWMLSMSLAILSHPLLDLLTPYGTQLLQPFSNARFAINAMPIIDPLYTLILIAGLLLGWRAKALYRPQHIAALTLLLSSTYLGYGWLLNTQAQQAAQTQLADAGIVDARVSAFPTIFQVHYRRVVARLPDRDLVGFYSTWEPCIIDWHSAERVDQALLSDYLESREGRVFDWFTMGWAHYQTTQAGNEWQLSASDLRYGFDADPLRSVFSMSTRLSAGGRVLAPILAGRELPADAERSLVTLLTQTYAPACQILH